MSFLFTIAEQNYMPLAYSIQLNKRFSFLNLSTATDDRDEKINEVRFSFELSGTELNVHRNGCKLGKL